MKNNPVLEAFLNGLAELVKHMFGKAKQKGFDIMLLVVVASILFWRSVSVEAACEAKMERLEEKMDNKDRAWSNALNIAREDWLKCDSLRQLQSIQIERQAGELSMLKSEVKYLRSR